jgi:trk system potassium uptake protein TrkA
MGFDHDTLREAGVEKADALAAVTNGDNSNVLIARVARETFSVDRVCARIYDPRRAEIYQRLGIPTVATVAWTTDQVLRRLLPDDQHHDWVDAGGSMALVERHLPPQWAGHRVAELGEPGRFSVVGVTRLGTARLVTPELVAQDGDILHVLSELSAVEALRDRLDDVPAARVH